tara:strand:- start:4046 stop:4324 length:279 start_codon:yes stop_codon:yes gene_type:complete
MVGPLTKDHLGEEAEVGDRLTILRSNGQYVDGTLIDEGKHAKHGLYLRLRDVESYAEPGDTPRPVNRDRVILLGEKIEAIYPTIDDSLADLE